MDMKEVTEAARNLETNRIGLLHGVASTSAEFEPKKLLNMSAI